MFALHKINFSANFTHLCAANNALFAASLENLLFFLDLSNNTHSQIALKSDIANIYKLKNNCIVALKNNTAYLCSPNSSLLIKHLKNLQIADIAFLNNHLLIATKNNLLFEANLNSKNSNLALVSLLSINN